MPALLIALLKINLVLLLFAAAYYLILRRLTFYTLNRSFLLFGILFSSAYPLIDLTELFYRQKNIPAVMATWVPTALPPPATGMVWIWITGLLMAGALVMAIRLAAQFITLYRLHQRSEKKSVNDVPVRIVNEKLSPFSFWKNIYINPSLHKPDELQHILAHENVHIKQLHTADILLAEICVIFYWFNPGVWLMKKAIKENLEFITDEKVLKAGTDKKSYQYSLLDVGQLRTAAGISNSFNLSDLKKRIRMMNAKRSSKLTLSRYLFLLPLLILVCLAFTVTRKDLEHAEKVITSTFTNTHTQVQLNGENDRSQQQAVTENRQQNRTPKPSIAKERSGRPRQSRDAREETAQTILVKIEDSFTAPPAIRVSGVQLADTIPGRKAVTAAAPGDETVITVVGYPTRKKSTETTSDNDTGAVKAVDHKAERIVVGYPIPKRN